MGRLLNAIPRDGDTKEQRQNNQRRMGRILRAGDRYVLNIAQSKQYANDIYGGKGVDVARRREYSQNTYMGINAG